jgi:hypothetical protein
MDYLTAAWCSPFSIHLSFPTHSPCSHSSLDGSTAPLATANDLETMNDDSEDGNDYEETDERRWQALRELNQRIRTMVLIHGFAVAKICGGRPRFLSADLQWRKFADNDPSSYPRYVSFFCCLLSFFHSICNAHTHTPPLHSFRCQDSPPFA